jgi:hypothetical protein
MTVRAGLKSAFTLLGFLLITFSFAVAQDTATLPTAPPKKPAPTKPVRARAKAATQTNVAATQAATTPAVSTIPAAAGTAATTAASPIQPAAARSAAPSNPSGGGTAQGADRGTLAQGNVIFTPVSCVHNGTKAVCTFTFVNQGNPGNMVGLYMLPTMQFVDDAHVPHRSDARYFLDKYGTRQPRFYANSGDSGTFVAEYVNVDARVNTGEFHLKDQTVGGIPVSTPDSAQPGQAGAEKK